MSDLVRNPEDRFSCVAVDMKKIIAGDRLSNLFGFEVFLLFFFFFVFFFQSSQDRSNTSWILWGVVCLALERIWSFIMGKSKK